jgi:conjugative relaxase-like TrwC/TraI family protein
LGLTGHVRAEDFAQAFDGFSSGEPLSKNAGDASRLPGWDTVYSAPKSASIVRAIADANLQERLDEKIRAAVRAANEYLEEHAAFTRFGAQGTESAKGRGLTISTHMHMFSRTEDPQWHVHSLIFNFTEANGRWRTLDGSRLYAHSRAAGALFQSELAKGFEELGFRVERDRWSFRVTSIPQSLEKSFSKRSEQIREVLDGPEATSRAKDVAAQKTREPKNDIDRDRLFADWREESAKHGVTAGRIEAARKTLPERDREHELREATRAALLRFGTTSEEAKTTGESHFKPQQFIQFVAEQGLSRGLSASDVRDGVRRELQAARRGTSEAIVYLGQDQEGSERFTTRDIYELEKELLQAAEDGKGSTRHRVSDDALEKALRSKTTITDEQKEAVRRVTQHEGEVQCLVGWAGTGKSYSLAAARDAWEAEGFKVIGAAVAGKAAGGLEKSSGIESTTVRKVLYDLKNQDKPRSITLDSKTVLVIDEAGMVGTKDLHQLVAECRTAGAKLVLVGDDKQLQSIDAGGGFGSLAKRLGHAEIKDITRQRDKADIKAVKDLATGNAAEAFKSYAERGRLALGETRAEAMRLLVNDYRKDRTGFESRLILTTTNHQAQTLNRMVQDERRAAGELGAVFLKCGEQRIHLEDRVILTKRAARQGVENGMLGTLTAYDPIHDRATIRLDDGSKLDLSLKKYEREHIKLSYAVTTHKAQGATVENAYVFAYGNMADAQMGYVMASRARGETRIYSTTQEAGEELSELSRSFARDRRKELAHDVEARSVEPTQEMQERQRQEQLRHRHELRHQF